MKNQNRKTANETIAGTDNPDLGSGIGAELGTEENELHPVDKLLLDFLARRRKAAGLPPPSTREDFEDDLRSVANPTDEEQEEGRRAVESARKRRARGEAE